MRSRELKGARWTRNAWRWMSNLGAECSHKDCVKREEQTMSVKSDQKTHSIDPQLPAAIGGASIEGKGEKVKMKKWAAWFFGLLIVGCGAALPPPTNLAVLIALSAPTATLTAEFESTKKAAKNSKKGTAK